MGFFEKDDVSTVVNYLKKEEKIEKIAIWGRSMGATSALLYCLKKEENLVKKPENPLNKLNLLKRNENSLELKKFNENPLKKLHENSLQKRNENSLQLKKFNENALKNPLKNPYEILEKKFEETAKNLPLYIEKPLINFLVLDSPFCSLKALVEEIAEAKTKLPFFIIKGLVSLINSSIKKEAGFSIENVDISENIKEIQVPMMILAAKNDKIVNFWHCQRIYQRFTGEKQLLELDLEHNEARKSETIEKIAKILKEKLKENDCEKNTTEKNIKKNTTEKNIEKNNGKNKGKNCEFSNFNDKYHLFKGKPDKMLIKAQENYCEKDSEFEIRPRSSTISGNNSNISNIVNLTSFLKSSKRENSLIIAHKVEKKEISEDLSINEGFSYESEDKKENLGKSVLKTPISSRIYGENHRNLQKKHENNKENTNFSTFGEFFTIKRRENSKKSEENENKPRKKASCSTTPSFKSKLMKILRENRIVDSQKQVIVKEFTLY